MIKYLYKFFSQYIAIKLKLNNETGAYERSRQTHSRYEHVFFVVVVV